MEETGSSKWENRTGAEAEAIGTFFEGRKFFTRRGGNQKVMGTEHVTRLWVAMKEAPYGTGSLGQVSLFGLCDLYALTLKGWTKTEGLKQPSPQKLRSLIFVPYT